MKNVVTRVAIVISDFIAAHKSFTLRDVSNAVNADGGDYVTPAAICEVGRPMLDILVVSCSEYYTEGIIVDTPKGRARSTLYMPNYETADNYTNRSQVAVKPMQAATKPMLVPTPVSDDNDDDYPTNTNGSIGLKTVSTHLKNAHATKSVNVRADGAIEISKNILKEAGLLDVYVSVVNHPNSISLVLGPDREASHFQSFRISKKTLAASGLNKMSRLTLAAFGDKIVISK